MFSASEHPSIASLSGIVACSATDIRMRNALETSLKSSRRATITSDRHGRLLDSNSDLRADCNAYIEALKMHGESVKEGLL